MEGLITTFGIDWRMLAIQIVNFGVLLTALWYFLYKPMLQFLDKRRSEVVEAVQKSEQAELKLKDAAAAKTKKIAEAAREAMAIMDSAQVSAQAQAAALLLEAQQRAERTLLEAHERAEEVKRKTLIAQKAEIARMAVLGAEKTLHKKVQSSV